jgi:hypothetical protein
VSALNRRTCLNCGAQNPVSAHLCVRCGQPLPKPDDLGRLWGVDPNAGPGGEGAIDLTPRDDVSAQVTAPLGQTRRFDPLIPEPEPRADPWSSRGSRLSAPATGATVSYPPAAPAMVPVAARRRGPGGCLLGLLAVLIIVAVGGAFAWTVARPLVSDRIRDELNRGVATQVAAIDAPVLRSPGQITVTEEQINREIAAFAGSYDPVENVRVRILKDEIRVTFDLYGTTSTYSGGVAVKQGRIVVVDPELSGAAGQLLDAQDVAEIVETQLAALLERSNVRPTAVRLRDGTLTVTTKRA